MANQISAKEYTLWELMKGEFVFNIPDYQRPYSWTKNEAVTLWDDLTEFWAENAANSERSYFIGSIVLVKKNDSPEAEVIDGQQRLSTISIILSVLAKYSDDFDADIRKCLWEEGIKHKGIPGRPRLTLRGKDRYFFEEYIAHQNVEKLVELETGEVENESQRLIWENTKELMKRISAFANDNDVSAFVKMLLEQCCFVVVTTEDNESAFRVFSVMNNRGLSLMPSDIIKAHIIGGIEKSKRQEYTDRWEDIEAEFGRESFNSLLSHIRTIYGKNKLHGHLVEEFERLVYKQCKTKEGIIDDIIEPYSDAFRNIYNETYAAPNGAEDVNDSFYWLKKVDDSDWVPAIMCALVKYGKKSDYIRNYVSAVEKIAAFFYLSSKTSNQRIERYAKSIERIQADDLEGSLNALRMEQKEQKEFLSVLDSEVYLMPARKRSFLLLKLDRLISDNAAKYKSDVYSIEHVMPQNPKKDSQWLNIWPDEEKRSYWQHRIANLVLLTRKKNSASQNFEFEKKKTVYFKSNMGVTTYALTTDVIAEVEWTPSVVEQRQARLLKIMMGYWNLGAYEKQNNLYSKDDEKMVHNRELERQNILLSEIELMKSQPEYKNVPQIEFFNLKAGKFVRFMMHKLFEQNDFFSDVQIKKLCMVEYSKKYTHRNLPFLLPIDSPNINEALLQRYWRSSNMIETYKGKKYYVYSQWYQENKGHDAHKSDFLQLYIDIIKDRL